VTSSVSRPRENFTPFAHRGEPAVRKLLTPASHQACLPYCNVCARENQSENALFPPCSGPPHPLMGTFTQSPCEPSRSDRGRFAGPPCRRRALCRAFAIRQIFSMQPGGSQNKPPVKVGESFPSACEETRNQGIVTQKLLDFAIKLIESASVRRLPQAIKVGTLETLNSLFFCQRIEFCSCSKRKLYE
jgi:hypothetical protein